MRPVSVAVVKAAAAHASALGRSKGNQVSNDLAGVEFKDLAFGSVVVDGVLFLNLDRFPAHVVAGISVGLTLEHAHGVRAGVEGVEAVLDHRGLAAGEIDQ